ncbi:hypothetical protein GGS23DRAFT_569014 [Durotheca rogersii]|uniref:uncharacterized protein n=1 Tax=Durotheca rogersii TaxID=419775 RepID=UPI00221F18EC|nr:uncharacterized protein GGS23DRAFT_569014 [Durotheca rogersii]KAI5863265.1 hypothetical protein GGS23DRAFT_569014 [Durotheca rogersii]
MPDHVVWPEVLRLIKLPSSPSDVAPSQPDSLPVLKPLQNWPCQNNLMAVNNSRRQRGRAPSFRGPIVLGLQPPGYTRTSTLSISPHEDRGGHFLESYGMLHLMSFDGPGATHAFTHTQRRIYIRPCTRAYMANYLHICTSVYIRSSAVGAGVANLLRHPIGIALQTLAPAVETEQSPDGSSHSTMQVNTSLPFLAFPPQSLSQTTYPRTLSLLLLLLLLLRREIPPPPVFAKPRVSRKRRRYLSMPTPSCHTKDGL